MLGHEDTGNKRMEGTDRYNAPQSFQHFPIVTAVQQLPHLIPVERLGAGADTPSSLGSVESQISGYARLRLAMKIHATRDTRRGQCRLPASMRLEILAMDSILAA